MVRVSLSLSCARGESGGGKGIQRTDGILLAFFLTFLCLDLFWSPGPFLRLVGGDGPSIGWSNQQHGWEDGDRRRELGRANHLAESCCCCCCLPKPHRRRAITPPTRQAKREMTAHRSWREGRRPCIRGSRRGTTGHGGRADNGANYYVLLFACSGYGIKGAVRWSLGCVGGAKRRDTQRMLAWEVWWCLGLWRRGNRGRGEGGRFGLGQI